MVVNAGRTNHKAALDFTEEEIHALFNINVSFEFGRMVQCGTAINGRVVALRRFLLCARGCSRLHSA